jgi:predicted aldo/keto reductase-like oxidoreductase
MKKLGFGLMRLPLTNSNDYASANQETSTKMVDYFFEQGGTYFDTAYMYHLGNSEIIFKKTVTQRHPRNAFTIADKMPVWLVKETGDYQKYFDEQLERCGVDYFDYYLLHALSVQGYADALKHGGFEFLGKMKAEGKARHIGFSYHDNADLLDKILTEQNDVDFVQLQINYIDWNSEAIQSRKCYEVAAKHGKPVIVMEPVKGGTLALLPEEADSLFKIYSRTASAASWAIRFAASLKNVMVVLSGMSALDQLVDNAAYMRNFKPLNDHEQAIIKRVTEIINRKVEIPCTACAYCIEGCPQKIAIPQYFSLYNTQKQFGLTPAERVYYNNLTAEFGKASDCIGCKQCEEHCPQHIAIAEQLKEVAKVFENSENR